MYGRIHDSDMGAYLPRVALALQKPQANQKSASEVEVSTSSGTISTRPTAVHVPGMLELYMYGKVSDPVMERYPPLMMMAIQSSANQQSE